MPASWFEDLVGFTELSCEETRANLEVVGTTLRSRVNDRSYAIGVLETPSLAELRDRAAGHVESSAGALRVSMVVGDVGQLHRDPTNQHALFQVASQFNLLEMTGPDMRRALATVQDVGLDVRIVSYGQPDLELERLAEEFD